jgi:hypothetical protein
MSTFDDLTQMLHNVYVRHGSDFVEIQPEYVYLTIPAKYISTYHKILVMLADYGIGTIVNCENECGDGSKTAIRAFNLFNSAIAAYKLNKQSAADTIISYINALIKTVYNGTDNIPDIVYPVDEHGHITAIVSGLDNPKFYVDVNTGILWEKFKEGSLIGDYALDEQDVPELSE